MLEYEYKPKSILQNPKRELDPTDPVPVLFYIDTSSERSTSNNLPFGRGVERWNVNKI